jgi:hypothetical protein
MDRITHQSPRQRGYGSTSSLRNDSLMHERKHERNEEGIEQKNKAARLWRTVRPGGADCPHGPRGLSAQVPRTVRPGPRTVRKSQQNLQKRTPINGPSAGSTRTVRQAPADCPPDSRGPSETSPNQNSKSQRIENEDEQEHEEHTTNTMPADRSPGPRGPSARRGQNQKLLDPKSQHLQSITGSPKR